VLADQDFAVFSQSAWQSADHGVLELGRVAFWLQAGGNNALQAWTSLVRFTPIEEASTVFYGTDGGVPIAAVGSIARKAYARYRQLRQARATYDVLRHLDDWTLRDIGFDRSELKSVAAEMTGMAEHTRQRLLSHLER